MPYLLAEEGEYSDTNAVVVDMLTHDAATIVKCTSLRAIAIADNVDMVDGYAPGPWTDSIDVLAHDLPDVVPTLPTDVISECIARCERLKADARADAERYGYLTRKEARDSHQKYLDKVDGVIAMLTTESAKRA